MPYHLTPFTSMNSPWPQFSKISFISLDTVRFGTYIHAKGITMEMSMDCLHGIDWICFALSTQSLNCAEFKFLLLGFLVIDKNLTNKLISQYSEIQLKGLNVTLLQSSFWGTSGLLAFHASPQLWVVSVWGAGQPSPLFSVDSYKVFLSSCLPFLHAQLGRGHLALWERAPEKTDSA